MMERETSIIGEIVDREYSVRRWHAQFCSCVACTKALCLAVAKAVVAVAADTIENGKIWYEHPDDCRTRCQHALMEASKAIRALAADPSGGKAGGE